MGKLVFKRVLPTTFSSAATKRIDAQHQAFENHQNFVVSKNRECENKVMSEFKKDLSVNRIDPSKFDIQITRG